MKYYSILNTIYKERIMIKATRVFFIFPLPLQILHWQRVNVSD